MTSSRWTSIVRGTVALIWIGCAGYISFHNWEPLKVNYLSLFFRETPYFFFDIPAAFHKLFSDGLRELVYVFVLLLASAGTGRLALAAIGLSFSSLADFIISVALGLATLSYSTFILGLLGLYNNAGAIVSTVTLLFLACYAIWHTASLKYLQEKTLFSWTATGTVFLIGVVAVFLFAKALWPAVYVDAVTYHLGIPNYYLQEGAFVYIPEDMCSGYPFITEMLYTLAMLVAGQKAAQCTSVLIFLLSILAVYEFSKTLLGVRYAGLTCVVYTLTPCLMDATLTFGNDLCLVYYMVMATYCFFLWHMQYRSERMLILIGLFAGICLSIKYTAFIFIPIPLLAGFIYNAVKNEERLGWPLLRRVMICGAATIIVCLPWMLKNILYTGNPIYPAFFSVFGGEDINPEIYAVAARWGGSVSADTILTAAFQKFQGLFLFSPPFSVTYGLLGNTGLVFLFFLPLLLFMRRTSAIIKALVCCAGFMFILWIATYGAIRYYYPGIAFLLIITSYVIVRTVTELPMPFRPFVVGATAACLILNMGMGFYQANMRTRTYGINFLHESDDTYLCRHMLDNPEALLTSYQVNSYINQHLSPETCVLIIGDVQHLYIHRKHRYTYLSATTPYGPFKKFAGANDAISLELKRRGITHILYNPHELLRLQRLHAIAWNEGDTVLIEAFLKSAYVRQLYSHKRSGREGDHFTQIKVDLYELI